MKKTFPYIILTIFMISSLACEEEYMSFQDVPRIQFGTSTTKGYLTNTTPAALIDTMKNYSFVYAKPDITQDSVFFDIYITGGPVNYDREFKLVQIKEPNAVNAEPGKHYMAFDNPDVSQNYRIKAGKVHSRFTVVVLRDESLKTQIVALRFTVEENQYFKLGENHSLWRKTYFSDLLSRPQAWGKIEGYIGKYSQVKHRFMIEVSGNKWDEHYISIVSPSYMELTFWTQFFRVELQKYNKAHPDAPLTDENGKRVYF